MRPADRFKWILEFMQRGSGRSVDVLYSDFVIEYIEATKAVAFVQFFGAPKCPQLGRDLAEMHRKGILDRYPQGLPAGDASMGFPKWVYIYSIRNLP